ncbi:hypothetical protein RhiLY_02532 [Ceratobasidium sp. AG-Ba]|nr:hypothetical protein RhiLY_02532 [Ceratobasidium sp. AG-Ba]
MPIQELGQRLQVAAIVDPNIQRAHEVLSRKLASPDTAPNYANAQICGNISDLPSTQPPRLVVIGTHPCSRGMDLPGRDLELQVMRHFPGVPLFVEKPVSTGMSRQLGVWRIYCRKMRYVLCWLYASLPQGGPTEKQIIQDNNLVVMGTNSRYYGAYANGARLDWWDKSREQGPIVEQATHFCPHPRSTLTPPSPTGSTHPAIGSMTHSTILQGTKYACEFEVYCDGHTMRLSDPYGAPVLSVRRAGQDDEDVERYEDDDPFYSEAGSSMLSTYQDACRSYELTWAQEASERASVKSE